LSPREDGYELPYSIQETEIMAAFLFGDSFSRILKKLELNGGYLVFNKPGNKLQRVS